MSGDAEQRAAHRIAVAFGVTTVAALALMVVYVRGGQNQLEGSLIAVALAGIGYAFVVAARRLLPQGPFTEAREPLESSDEDSAAFAQDFAAVYNTDASSDAVDASSDAVDASSDAVTSDELGRRKLIVRMFFIASGAVGLAALFPIASLGPRPGKSLFQTMWRRGSRVVDEQGKPVSVPDLEVGAVLTVFPEGSVGVADSQTLLIRLSDQAVTTRKGRETWAPHGYVAFSKVCTHAGCPVGLYQQSTQRLLCPCHQSTFAVASGATPVFGPATRSLPQLPLMVDDQGYLVSQSDYDTPIGPGFWNRNR
jgi:quinol---cytochrome c reductase iron-sulfur subunit